jgi:hypothetical protein
VFDADGGSKEVVRKIQAFAASQSNSTPSASTSAYCQARNKLETDNLKEILRHTGETLQDRGQRDRWKNRRVVVVDGTGVSMPDTPANQEKWPQSSRHISLIQRSIFMGSCYFRAIGLFGFSPDLARCTKFSSRGHIATALACVVKPRTPHNLSPRIPNIGDIWRLAVKSRDVVSRWHNGVHAFV